VKPKKVDGFDEKICITVKVKKVFLWRLRVFLLLVRIAAKIYPGPTELIIDYGIDRIVKGIGEEGS